MFAEHIAAALEQAEYEIIDDPEPYYAHVPGLQGVWATGKTFEGCRKELRGRREIKYPSFNPHSQKSLSSNEVISGMPLEMCKLSPVSPIISTIEGWIVLGLRMGQPIPPVKRRWRTRAASCGASKAPPHKCGTRLI